MKHHPSCGTTYMEDCDCATRPRPSPMLVGCLKRCAAVEDENAKLRAALSELTAMVRGECPSLLNEDSGGCGRLDIEIDELLRPNDQVKGDGTRSGPVGP